MFKLKKINQKIQKTCYNYVENLKNILNKFRNLSETNLELALYHIKQGNITDAVIRLNILLKIDPENVEAKYQLGKCYLFERKKDKANILLREAFKHRPNDANIRYLLATFNDDIDFPNNIPLEIISSYFNNIAENYDDIYLNSLQYQAHKYVAKMSHELILKQKNPEKKLIDILDVGAGTGLYGMELKYMNNNINLAGLDCAENMLTIFKSRIVDDMPVYNDSICNDFNSFFGMHNYKYDMIIACNSLIYYSDLSVIFNSMKKILNVGGHIIFTLYNNVNTGYTIDSSKEFFIHNEDFVEQEIKKSKLKLITKENIDITKKNTGTIYVTRL